MIFNDAANLNMTGAGYVWIVTEQALDAPNAPDGLLGLKLINATQEKSHISDSLSVYVLNSVRHLPSDPVSIALHICLYLESIFFLNLSRYYTSRIIDNQK